MNKYSHAQNTMLDILQNPINNPRSWILNIIQLALKKKLKIKKKKTFILLNNLRLHSQITYT